MMSVTAAEHGGQAWRVTGEHTHQRSFEDLPEEKGGHEGQREVGHPGANRVRGKTLQGCA